MIWEIFFAEEASEALCEKLGEGWEPYAVVSISGVGVVHYLRRKVKK